MTRLRVKELAEEQGLSISGLVLKANRLAPDARLSYPTVHALWHNRTQRPALDTLTLVARALGVSVGSLLTDDDDAGQERPQAEELVQRDES
jgi:hypothetical protein